MGKNSRGYKFEERVKDLLCQLSSRYPDHVTVNKQPTLELFNGDKLRPDFELKYNLGFHIEANLIECQSRNNSSLDIVHKIRNAKSLSRRNRFLFVYENSNFLSHSNEMSLRSDGINCYSFDEFITYIYLLDRGLRNIHKSHYSEESELLKKKSLRKYLSLFSSTSEVVSRLEIEFKDKNLSLNEMDYLISGEFKIQCH